ITGISGASPNHPKKQIKKADHDMWNARMGTLEKSANRMLVALFLKVIRFSLCVFMNRSDGETQVSTRDARLHPHRDRKGPQTLRKLVSCPDGRPLKRAENELVLSAFIGG